MVAHLALLVCRKLRCRGVNVQLAPPPQANEVYDVVSPMKQLSGLIRHELSSRSSPQLLHALRQPIHVIAPEGALFDTAASKKLFAQALEPHAPLRRRQQSADPSYDWAHALSGVARGLWAGFSGDADVLQRECVDTRAPLPFKYCIDLWKIPQYEQWRQNYGPVHTI